MPPYPHPRRMSPSSSPQPGTYCCGPVPVRAIKEGDLSVKYDAPFVFAEVNADVVDWIRQEDGTMHKSVNHRLVGLKISTKRVGRDEREDITHTYKYPEGRCPQPPRLPCPEAASFTGPVCVLLGRLHSAVTCGFLSIPRKSLETGSN